MSGESSSSEEAAQPKVMAAPVPGSPSRIPGAATSVLPAEAEDQKPDLSAADHDQGAATATAPATAVVENPTTQQQQQQQPPAATESAWTAPPEAAPPPTVAAAAAAPPASYPGYPPAEAYGAYVHPGYSGYYPPPQYSSPPPPAYGYPPPGYPGYPPAPAYYGYPGYPGYPAYPGYPPPAYPYAYPAAAPPSGSHYTSRSRSRSRGRVTRGGAGDAKFTCRFFIGIDNEEEFRVCRRIIGANGQKMKNIVSRSGGDAKLRLRGAGSGYNERDTHQESPEPLQLCISCPTHDGYEIARREAEALLLEVYREYDTWCADKGRPNRAPKIHYTEKHHAGDGRQRSNSGSRRRRNRSRGRGGGGNGATPAPGFGFDGDKGTPPPSAPYPEEIEKSIEDRNEARRKGDYARADQIRDELKAKGVVLSDQKGAHGGGLVVTSWRYWHD